MENNFIRQYLLTDAVDVSKSGKKGGKKKKMKKPPEMYQTPCCQICPHKFMASLEVFEATHEEKRKIYKNFHAFHRRHYSKRETPLPDSLDVFLETAPLENPAPPALLAPGDENCCALCPKGFKDVERMKTIGAKQGFNMFFLEEEEKLKYTESKYTGAFKNFCCSICAHQFYPPREFFDYENIMDAQAPSFLETMYDLKDRNQNDGMGCCVACRKDMYGGVADSAWERNFAASSNSEKAGKGSSGGGPINRISSFMTDMAPRNPENMRDYKSGKHGGPIDPSQGQNSALVLSTPRTESTAGT